MPKEVGVKTVVIRLNQNTQRLRGVWREKKKKVKIVKSCRTVSRPHILSKQPLGV